VLSCGAKHEDEDEAEDDDDKEEKRRSQERGRKIRIILNDGVVPLTGIRGCLENEEGLCDMGVFVESVTELMAEGDPDQVCR
jgi:hypothetical protein